MNSYTRKHFLNENVITTQMPDFEDEIEDFGYFEERRKETEQFLQAVKNLQLLSVDSYSSAKQKKNNTIATAISPVRLRQSDLTTTTTTTPSTTSSMRVARIPSPDRKETTTTEPKLRIARIPSPVSYKIKEITTPKETTKTSTPKQRPRRKRSNSKDAEDVTEELWKIYVWYSTHGDPTTPQSLAYTEWIRFLRDCGVLKSSGSFIGDGNAQHAQLIYKQVTRSGKNNTIRKKRENMCFRDFLQGVMHVSFRLFPHRDEDKEFQCERAYERLLRKYVLPNAKRLKPIDISDFESDTKVVNILRYYEKSLLRIFQNYSRHMGQYMRYTSTRKRFLKYLDRSSISPREYCISADRWLKFCNDFGLNRIISMCKLVHIYLASATTLDRNSGIHELQFKGFMNALLRAATVLYEDPQTCRGVPRSNQFRGLLLWMFRSISAESREFSSYIQTRKVREISRTNYERRLRPDVCRLFQKTFIQDWQKANYSAFGLYQIDGIYHTRHADRQEYVENKIRSETSPKRRRNTLAGGD
jgi:hypothetical protein